MASSTSFSPPPSPSTLWTRRGAPEWEHVCIGIFYLASSLLFIFLQISVILVIFLYRDFRAHLCYLLMAIISMADLLQLVVHAYGGAIALANNSFVPMLEKLAGGFATSMSIVSFALEFVLSLDRLLVFLPIRLLSARNERLLFGILVLASLLIGTPFMAIYASGHSAIVFRQYAWEYDANNANTVVPVYWQWVPTVSETIPFPFAIGTLLVYMAIMAILWLQRQKVSQQSQGLLAPHERRLLCQAFAQFGVECSLCSIWFWQMVDRKNSPNGLIATVFVNWYWIFFNGFKPLLYLAINRTIRDRLLHLWREQSVQKDFHPSMNSQKTLIHVPAAIDAINQNHSNSPISRGNGQKRPQMNGGQCSSATSMRYSASFSPSSSSSPRAFGQHQRQQQQQHQQHQQQRLSIISST